MALYEDISKNLSLMVNGLVHFITLEEIQIHNLINSASATIVYKDQAIATMSCAWHYDGEMVIGVNNLSGHSILDYACPHALDAETFHNMTPRDFDVLISGKPWELIRFSVLAHASEAELRRLSLTADTDGIHVQ